MFHLEPPKGNVESFEPLDQSSIDPDNLEFEFAVGKRFDCQNLIYTTKEKQYYGKNKKENTEGAFANCQISSPFSMTLTLYQFVGEVAYLCRLYSKLKCKSRIYFKDGRLYRKASFVPHNHGCQDAERIDFQVQFSRVNVLNMQKSKWQLYFVVVFYCLSIHWEYFSMSREWIHNKAHHFQAEFEVKQECSNLDSLVNAGSQTSAVSAIFDRVMQR